MLKCDGFKMFHGTATVTPCNNNQPYDLTGTWLFHPERVYWYCEADNSEIWYAQGFPYESVSNIRDDEGGAA